MSLPFRCTRKERIRISSGLLCAVAIALMMPSPARAWHGDDWRLRHYQGYRSWGPRLFVPPPIRMGGLSGLLPRTGVRRAVLHRSLGIPRCAAVSLSFGVGFSR